MSTPADRSSVSTPPLNRVCAQAGVLSDRPDRRLTCNIDNSGLIRGVGLLVSSAGCVEAAGLGGGQSNLGVHAPIMDRGDHRRNNCGNHRLHNVATKDTVQHMNTLEPRQPAHADYTRLVAGLRGEARERIRVGRRLDDYAYARANPAYATPRYVWVMLVDGVVLGVHATKRDAVASARSMATAL